MGCWKKGLAEFLNGRARNAWIPGPGSLRCYVRRSNRFAEGGDFLGCLDIASVEANDEDRGKGLFREFFKESLESAARAGIPMLYVENVMNERFQGFFKKQGMSLAADDICSKSFRMMVPGAALASGEDNERAFVAQPSAKTEQGDGNRQSPVKKNGPRP